MLRLAKNIARTLSVRLSLMVVGATAVLLVASLFVMFHFSRKAVKEEALNKADQTLEATVQRIDYILLSVEQALGNMLWNIYYHLDEPDRMFVYSQKLIESNPFIEGCAVAFEPYTFPERGKYFMAYVYRADSTDLKTSDSPVIRAETFGNRPYNEQIWYTRPMETGMPTWVGPLKDGETNGKAIISFCLPLYGPDGGKKGVVGVDVALSKLSQVVQEAKPSPNSYATLLGSNGSFIAHPDSNKLFHQTVFTQVLKGTDPSVKEAAEAMMSGEKGYRYFKLDGQQSYVFFKPFECMAVPGRSTEKLGWSVGIVYPEDDIFGDYNQLLHIVIIIAIAGLLLLLVLCRLFTHHRLLPLKQLSYSAQRIADGNFDDSPVIQQHNKNTDEIGLLQRHFTLMQHSLATHMGEMERLTTELRERGKVLNAAYEQAKDADRMKTAFLHNMTNQMIMPVNNLVEDVNDLCQNYTEMAQYDIDRLSNDIQEQSSVITDLLNDMLNESYEENIRENA